MNDCNIQLYENQKTSSDYFTQVIGHIEDIVISDEFKELHNKLLEKYYNEFDDIEENKVIYTEIFEEYTTKIETFITAELNERMNNLFSMEKFAEELQCLKPELDGEIFELLFSLSDFLTFKEIMIDYKMYKERLSEDGNFEIFVTPITGIIED